MTLLIAPTVVISKLTDHDIKVKLCDFGYSRFMSSKVSESLVGTHGYIAPVSYCIRYTTEF